MDIAPGEEYNAARTDGTITVLAVETDEFQGHPLDEIEGVDAYVRWRDSADDNDRWTTAGVFNRFVERDTPP